MPLTIMCSHSYTIFWESTKWSQTNVHELAFSNIKNILASYIVLTHFDINAKIIVTVGVSSNGLEAILSQIGSEDEKDSLQKPFK